MSTATDAFLQGQGIPVDPRAIETELARLWGPAAQRIGGPELEHPNVTRVVLANLVVVGPSGGSSELEAALDVVSARFPARSIILNRTSQTSKDVTAEVTAQCHLPAPGMPQVCSERIILSAGPGAIGLLPGAVRPLLEADLPFVLWWADDPTNAESLFRDLAGECSRLVLDLPDPGASVAAIRLGLNPAICTHARESAWFGISRWRELLAQGFDPPCDLKMLAKISAVEIKVAVPTITAQPPRLAAWLVAWLAGQLDWKADGVPSRTEGRLTATFQGPSGPIEIGIEVLGDPGLKTSRLLGAKITTMLDGQPGIVRVERPESGSEQVRVSFEMPSACAFPRFIHAPESDRAHRVSSALESSRDDVPFRNALPHLLWLLEGDDAAGGLGAP